MSSKDLAEGRQYRLNLKWVGSASGGGDAASQRRAGTKTDTFFECVLLVEDAPPVGFSDQRPEEGKNSLLGSPCLEGVSMEP